MLLLVAATEMELCGRAGLVCGVGPVEAAAATARALAVDPPDAVLHIGLAGARGVPVGAVVVGSEAVYCDLSAEWPVVDRIEPDAALLGVAVRALPAAATHPIHTSAAVSGAGDPASQGPLVEGMEGFGVLRAAALAGVPAVEVRVVSNELGEPDRARWEVDRALEILAVTIESLAGALEAPGP